MVFASIMDDIFLNNKNKFLIDNIIDFQYFIIDIAR